ncbi:MAG: glutamine--fructose-6-phosphate transaminase (isomerizing) [Fusobacterium sp.]|uniref:glutamine--fructose-6-phosphate transaminase (isomerizing) n=1 Tax=uncultured Fusobacterium sp. TaxID=159267 RepID=UPI0019566E91|nr:glutamine--fructose-6-phosphate transaminase (isomerizing) [Fusobacterium sp.]MBM6689526.1 glutamine--fructose-6-phosphate transaminase (isomerizing) [Fusobacterium mortiferum]MDO5788062.1 glutamine--fructose-6-phosphate transaminase (isomerizing) [Fusobacterium sp.]
MCGIIGYVGDEQRAMEVILDGLSKLEYRGYDSAGLAIIENGKIFIEKKSGKLENLRNALKGKEESAYVGIGHTRWATHGNPTDENSHPHFSSDRKVAVVHNGIIENYLELKEELTKEGYVFTSQTDSEVVAHLFSKHYDGDMLSTLRKVTERIRGSYALGIIERENPDRLVCVRKESPLIIGLGKGKNFIASDVPAILKYTREVIFLDNSEMAIVEKDRVSVYDSQGKKLEKAISKIEWDMEQANKGGYPHFMLKEIEEQPEVIEKTLDVYMNTNGKVDFSSSLKKLDLSKIKEIYIVACGTAYHAGLQGAYFFKKISGIKTEVDIASEFRYSDPFIDESTLAIFISQSGETLDTLMAMKMAKEKGATTLAITNVLGSTISREADMVIYTLAGPEISVASTKAYTAQVTLFYLLALYFGEKKMLIDGNKYESYLDTIHMLSDQVKKVIDKKEQIRAIANKIKDKRNGFFIGRGIDDKCGREGSLKMKEITYIHTEAFSAGELKHGTIALIEEGTMVVAIATQEDMIEKIISNIKEVKARGAYVIALTKEKYKNVADISDEIILIDDVEDILAPTVANISLQLLAYYTAVEKGLDVDKPRNLAKSVTVE